MNLTAYLKHSILAIGAALLGVSLNAQTNYILNGTAAEAGEDCYLITNDALSQNGTVWADTQIDLNNSFDIEYTAFFGFNDSGADGMMFVFQQEGTDAIGELGGGIGFEGFAPSVGIEFDTYQNGENSDPVFDHTAVHSNGNVLHNAAGNLFGPVALAAGVTNIEDGQDHDIRITWEACTETLRMFFDDQLSFETTIDFVAIFGTNLEVFWGFTGATGGLSNLQTVCLEPDILAPPSENYFMCNGSTIQLEGLPDSEVLWTPSTFLSDPTVPNPFCSATEDITYTSTYTGLCGETSEIIVEVDVEELTLEVSEPATLDCNTTEVGIIASTNLGDTNINYTDPDGQTNESETGIIVADQTGEYIITADFDGACETTETVIIEGDFETYSLNPSPVAILDCNVPEPTIGVATDGDFPAYNWTNEDGVSVGGDNAEIEVDEGGTYTVQVTNTTNGCSSSATVEVVDNVFFPEISISQPDSLSCELREVDVNTEVSNTGDDFTIAWQQPSSSQTVGGLQWTTSTEGIYTATVTNPDNGCSSDDLVIVHAQDDFYYDYSSLTMPNVITPNEDDWNTEFKAFFTTSTGIDLDAEIASVDLLVYDRWGKEVFRSTGLNRWWKGLKDDRELAEGTYYYAVTIDFVCSRVDDFEKAGFVTISR